ncbi:zf-TFIIB domain-containing protein [Thalassoglobus sp.]|uniref:zf-TFIIB domain-containing protein n=1 Tax=Thalassoglobus sp. TaxID=2795869 RepID=UPI003AA86E10
MKCQSCGGPLNETAGRGRLVCTYCGTLNVPKAGRLSADRITLLEEFSDHRCPGCEQQLSRAMADEAFVESCSSCQGILFERDVFMSVAWDRRGQFQGAEETPIPIDPAELKERRNCPKCQQLMETHPYYGPGNAVIDSCHRCQLVWLDTGELTAIERAPGQRQLRS